jgi:methyl-accepting chemotaxis protein WspA
MKNMTTWQRLNVALTLLVVLLASCAGLSLWMAQTGHLAELRSVQLSDYKDRLFLDVSFLSESVQSVLLAPRSDLEKKRRSTEADLKVTGLDLQQRFPHCANLASAAKALQEFTLGTAPGSLGHFQSRALELAQTNPAAAQAFYQTEYPTVSRQRDQVFNRLATEITAVTADEAEHAKGIALGGLLGIFGLLIASGLLVWWQSSAIGQPLNQLVAALERMRQGDFTERLTLERKDEFGVLGEGLNRLADNLSELVGQVQHSGIQVNTTATQIAANAREQESTAHEIAATTAEIGATSKEISATSKELEKTMNEVNQVAEETANLAGSGQAAISRMEATMRQIMDASGSVTSKLAVLSEKTTNINSVVTTITKVADQTNLLSLNAAIEAEKAGEYGLGFAVVAMEIRRLADQTAVATYDIEKMVKEMQSAVSAGVVGMDKFSEEVRRGVEEVRQVSTHLAQIIHQVQTFTPRFQTVNEGMHAQATGAQQISETLTQLSEASQQTAESLRQFNQAIEQLNGAARGLQTSVARFKLAT